MPIIDSIKKKNIKPILEVNCRPQPGQDEALSARVRWHDGQIFMVCSCEKNKNQSPASACHSIMASRYESCVAGYERRCRTSTMPRSFKNSNAILTCVSGMAR